MLARTVHPRPHPNRLKKSWPDSIGNNGMKAKVEKRNRKLMLENGGHMPKKERNGEYRDGMTHRTQFKPEMGRMV